MVYSDRLRLLNPALPSRQVLYQYGYAMDPDPVMSCSSLNPSARLIYRAILRLCGRGTVCKVSVDQIATLSGVSARSVQRHITTLTLRGLIETEEEPGFPTIYRLLPLPSWIIEGRKVVLPESRGQEGGGREPVQPEASGSEAGRELKRVFPSAGSTPPTMHQGRGGEDGPENRPGGVPPPSLSSAPDEGQDGGEGVIGCQRRGAGLSSHMDYKENKLENPISLSGLGSESGTRWTDQFPASEREERGENLEPVRGESKAETPPTPRQIVQATCQALGFRPTGAQVSFGVREVDTLFAGGFSLSEIGEGARYAAEQKWVRSFAGVKYYLPQALNAIALRGERGKAKGERRKGRKSHVIGGGGRGYPFPFALVPFA